MNKMLLSYGFIIILSIVQSITFAQRNPSKYWGSSYSHFQLEDLPINLKVEVRDSNQYCLYWESSYQKDVDQYLRTEELHCFIRGQKNQLLATYTGNSTPVYHCDFTTQDSIIKVIFKVQQAHFYPPEKESADSSQQSANLLRKIHIRRIDYCKEGEYLPVTIHLNSTKEQQLILKNNLDILKLFYVSKKSLYPDPMPKVGCSYNRVFYLSRYYLNTEKGKILKGKKWFRRNTIKKLTSWSDFKLIAPNAIYRDKQHNRYTGQELIQQRRIDMDLFDSGVWDQHSVNPY